MRVDDGSHAPRLKRCRLYPLLRCWMCRSILPGWKRRLQEISDDSTDPLNHPKFLEAVFSSQEVLNGTSNTAAVDIGGSVLIAAHVSHHQPAFRQPFESVKPHI